MRGIFRRGDVLAGAFILSVFVSLFAVTQVTRSADGAYWAVSSFAYLNYQAQLTADQFNTAPPRPCEDRSFALSSRKGGIPSGSLITTPQDRCAVEMSDAYFETGATKKGLMRSHVFSKAVSIEFPELGNYYMYGVPTSSTLVVHSWAYQNYFGGTSGLHVVRDYHRTMTNKVVDIADNATMSPAKPFDFELRGPDNKLVVVKSGGINFSANGQWMVFRFYSGNKLLWARLDLESYEVKTFAAAVQDYYGVYGAVSDDGRYVAIHEPLQSLRVYDLERCDISAARLVSQQCAYSEIYPKVEQDLGASELSFRALTFESERRLSFMMRSKRAGDQNYSYARYVLRYGDDSTANSYLALGDSFSSGEGAYDYRLETDFHTSDENYNRCHQSRSSYPYLLDETINFDWFGSVACSGAVMRDVAYSGKNTYQEGEPQAKGVFLLRDRDTEVFNKLLPGYRDQQRFIKGLSNQPKIITMSIGGNDIGFGKIMERCVHPKNTASTCYDGRDQREALANLVDQKIPYLTRLYESIRSQTDRPDARLYIIGYPRVVMIDGICGPNVGMNYTERVFAENLVNYLNDAVRTAALRAGVRYVDVSDAFVDEVASKNYQLCGDQSASAMNGLVLRSTSSKKPGEVNYQESYHPNRLGHTLMAKHINSATSGLSTSMPGVNKSAVQDAAFRTALVGDSDRRIHDASYEYNPNIAPTNPTIGDRFRIALRNLLSIAKPMSQVTIELHSTPQHLGTAVFDETGALDASVTIPHGVEPGYHELHLLYSDYFGRPVDVYQTVYIQASHDDHDGDGLDNTVDPCSMSDQSGIDVDVDGIDDACDDEYIRTVTDNENGAGVDTAGSGGTISPGLSSVAGTPVSERILQDTVSPAGVAELAQSDVLAETVVATRISDPATATEDSPVTGEPVAQIVVVSLLAIVGGGLVILIWRRFAAKLNF